MARVAKLGSCAPELCRRGFAAAPLPLTLASSKGYIALISTPAPMLFRFPWFSLMFGHRLHLRKRPQRCDIEPRPIWWCVCGSARDNAEALLHWGATRPELALRVPFFHGGILTETLTVLLA